MIHRLNGWMARVATSAAMVTIAAFAIGSGRIAAQGAPVFRTSTDAVRVDVSVQRSGRPVTGLRVEDFELLDNGVPQTISSFSYERWPIDATIMLDISRSVSGAMLNELRRAIRQLRSDLRGNDRVRVIAFNSRVTQLVEAGSPVEAIDTAFDDVRAVGSSAVFDALAVALASPAPADRRQLIVMFSDGQDNGSITPPMTLLDIARRTTPTITSVIASSAQRNTSGGIVGSSSFRFAALMSYPRLYGQLASITGGTVMPMGSSGLSGTFRRVLDDFRSSYVLHFVPQGVSSGGVHQLTVNVYRSNVEVRARREYVVP